MTSVRFPKLIPVARLLTIGFYRTFHSDESDGWVSEPYVGNLIPTHISKNMLAMACEVLRKQGYISKTKVDGVVKFRLSHEGLLFAEVQLENAPDMRAFFEEPDCDVMKLLVSDIVDLEDSGEEIDIWEPLPIDREAVEFVEAVQKTEEAIRVVESDNGFAVHYPNKRNSILASLRAGLDYLKSQSVTWSQLSSFILSPLKEIVAKFAKSLMSEAAEVALKAMKKWMETLF